jgi:Xaa-Pro aminopeptidase
MYFPKQEYEERWRRVYAEMKAKGYETAVIWGRSAGGYERCGDVLYLSNYYSIVSGQGYDWPKDWQAKRIARGFSAIIFSRGEKPELHMDMPSYQMDLLATDRVEAHGEDVIRGVSDALKRRKIEGRVAMVGTDFVSVKHARYLESLTPEISWIPEDDLVRTIRQIKSPRELECYRHAGRIVTKALDRLIQGLVDCKTEAEAAADAAYEVTRAGGRFHMIPVSHGDSIQYFCRNPLTQFSEDAPKPGDIVRGWVYGPIYQGYWLDPGRTAVAGGKPNADQRTLIERSVNLVEKIIEAIHPGVTCSSVAQVGNKLLQEIGAAKDQAAELFPLFGHGVGLFFEHPYIRPDVNQIFQENMVMGVEVFVSDPKIGSVGLEQNIIVGKDKNELLTTTPMIPW